MAITFLEAILYLAAVLALLLFELGKACRSRLGSGGQATPPAVCSQAEVPSVAARNARSVRFGDSAQATFDFARMAMGDEAHTEPDPFIPPVPAPTTAFLPAKKAVSFKKQFIGTLIDFGVGEFTDTRSVSSHPRRYQSFYVTVELDDGAIETKQGVELETAIQQSGAAKGERIELMFLGREKIEDADEGKSARYRNRWRINRL